MRQAVRDVFFDYTAGREGFTPFMYCDVLNLVTTGVGNLIDAGPNHNPGGNAPSAVRARLNNEVSATAMLPAMKLPWRLKAPGWTSKNPVAGDLVSPAEIADAWTKVKRQNEAVPDFSQRGGFAYAGLTNLTLDMTGLKELFSRTLNSFDASLASTYPTYAEWPADAQLAILSMSWAMGPAFFPHIKGTDGKPAFQAFHDAAVAQDFTTAGARSTFKGGGSVLDPASRNFAHDVMFKSAAAVVKAGGDRNRLFFPGTSGRPSPGVPSTAPPSLVSKVFNPRIGQYAAGTVAIGACGWGIFEWWKGRK